jgi:hypothetical protein
VALGGAWDGLPSLLSLNAPADRRGWYAMIPQLGAPLGLIVASGAVRLLPLRRCRAADFLSWGWRYPFFVAFAINVVALFARLRWSRRPSSSICSRAGAPARALPNAARGGRTIALGAFAPLASFALFHLVTVFPLSWVTCCTGEAAARFLIIEIIGAVVGVLAMLASGYHRRSGRAPNRCSASRRD